MFVFFLTPNLSLFFLARLGTKSGAVFLFEGGELKAEFDVSSGAGHSVEALTAFPRGFVVGAGHR